MQRLRVQIVLRRGLVYSLFMGRFSILIVGVFLLLAFFALFFQINKMSGSGMEPTIANGKTMLFWKYFLGGSSPARGDVVLHRKDEDVSDRVGRVVALPLELVRISGGNIYIDDTERKYLLHEDYIADGVETYVVEEDVWVKLGKFEYLVINDNRSGVIDIRKNLILKGDIQGVFIRAF